jgi:outer membrane protein OmpA-like peptidoglycan-associated protein
MANLKHACLPLLAAPLGACWTMHPNTEPALPAGHHFSYNVTTDESHQIVQAFDDGSATYLQFDDTLAEPIEIRPSTTNVLLAYTIQPHYVVIPGIYGGLRVSSGNHSSLVTNQDRPPESASRSPGDVACNAASGVTYPAGPSPTRAPLAVNDKSPAVDYLSSPRAEIPALVQAASVGVPETLQTMNSTLRVATPNREIAQLEERVRFLTEELEEAHRAGGGSMLYLRKFGGLPRIAVKFDDNSAEVKIEEALLGALGNTVRAANRLYLHGHTDAFVASEAGTELAIRRAVAVRNVLVSLDVEPERIRLFYRGAGNFVVNNSTREGKALNRRVEIELRKW